MIAPRIHLNGSNGEALLHDNLVALEALQAATKALQAASPNSRDYYVIGEDAFSQALGAHEKRLRRLEQICREIEMLAGAIYEQL